MNLKNMFYNAKAVDGLSGFFSAYGSFGITDGAESDMQKIQQTDTGYKAEYPDFSVLCECKELKNGVYLRNDKFISKKKGLALGGYYSRFFLEGGDYEVYTQLSGWQHESCGGWQDLITGIEVSNKGIRTTDSAAPMAVIRNKGNGKMLAVHLMPNAQWKIKISKCAMFGKCDGVLIETGINDKGLNLICEENEIIDMPAVLFYNTENMLDFDAWKLHSAYNTLYPRRRLPVLYNTWLYNFDRITVEEVCRQADIAADLGIEMFLIDAGWFGETENWGENIGIWKENLHTGFRGRLSEVSEYVRNKGMVFGMWLEPERALANTSVVKEHPEYFIRGNDGNCFLDFSNIQARAYILGVICNLIETYKIGFMKFDFNAALAYDESGCGFYRYFKGQKTLITELRQRYPEIYITNCASGGTRMELAQQQLFDSVWISDNQSPVDCIDIFKNTALRLPVSNMEKWDVRKYCDGFPIYLSDEKAKVPLSCDNATWTSLVTVSEEFTHAFISGGAMGFSGDMASYPESEKAAIKQLIAEYKSEREFYKTAVLRILHDTDSITVVQYSDEELSKSVIQAFFRKPCQDTLTIYPSVIKNARYLLDGTQIDGIELKENGYCISAGENTCTVNKLTMV